MFAKSGESTPLTQLTTFRSTTLGTSSSACAWCRVRGRQPIDDRRPVLVNVHSRDQCSNDVSLLEPRDAVEAATDARGKLLELRDDSAKMHRLVELPVGIVEIETCAINSRSNGLAARLEFLEIDR